MKDIAALQTHLYEILDADPNLNNKVLDEVPQDTSFPYVEIGYFEAEQGKMFGGGMSSIKGVIHVFDNSSTNKNILGIGTIISNIITTDGDATKDGYEIVFKDIEKEKIEKVFVDTSKELLRHVEIHVNFSLVKL